MKNSFAVVLLLAGSVVASAEDLKGKGEVDLFGGGIHISTDNGITEPNKAIFGADAAYGILPMVQLFGEFGYSRIDQGTTYATIDNFLGGAKVNLLKKSDKFEPYGLVGFGVTYFTPRASNPGSSPFATETDKALHLGGGVRVFPTKSKKWGVVPEFRWIHIFPKNSNDNATNVIAYTGGVFFRWGK